MNFAHPLALLLLLLVIPVAFLYWLRVRVPSRIVGTGPFWQKALAEEKGRWRWRRWRTKVSLAVQIILVALIAVAAAGPQIPASKHMVLIIDNSATMRATDVRPSRMDAAKEVARRFVDSLRSCDEMAVVTASPQPTEIQPLTSDHVLLAEAVDAVQATADPPAIDWAVKMAREIPSPDEDKRKPLRRTRILLITDASSQEATKQAQESGVEVLRVGAATGNLAITRFAVRRCEAEPNNCEALVEVRNQSNQSAQVKLTLATDDKPSIADSFEVKPDDCRQLILPLDLLPAAARLTARIEPGDIYRFDDVAVLDVPAAPAVHRVILTADAWSCLKETLAANRRVELIQDEPQAKAIHVIDGRTPDKLPAGPALIFNPRPCDLWQLGESVPDPLVTHLDESSPISAGVRMFDAYLPDARQLRIDKSVTEVAKPILWAGATPLGVAIDRPKGRVVVIAGNVAASNLVSQEAFPQLIGQALDWLDGQPPWKGEVFATCEQGTDIRVPGDIGSDAAALVFPKPSPPLWMIPAALAAVLVIIEWCLYQRRWTS